MCKFEKGESVMFDDNLAIVENVIAPDMYTEDCLYQIQLKGGYGSIFINESRLKKLPSYAAKCTCGSDSIRGWKGTNAHSRWCTKYIGVK